jgi:hypothetical protein
LGVLLFSGGGVRGVWQMFVVLRNDNIVVLVWGYEGFCEVVNLLIEMF